MENKTFSVKLNTGSNTRQEWNVTVLNGEVSKISVEDQLFRFGFPAGGTGSVYTPKDGIIFDESLSEFITILKDNQYEEFVSVLNQTVREKYFNILK